MNKARIAGMLFFLGGMQFIISMIISEAIYSNYSTSKNYISDLGLGSTAWLFNSSIILLGLTLVIGAYLFFQTTKKFSFSILLIITGLAAIGIGLLPKSIEPLHFIVSSITFISAALTAIMGYKLVKPPLSYFSVLIGILTLVAIFLFATKNYFGLGPGGMERMIVYPVLLLIMGFGAYLTGATEDRKK